MPRIKVRDKLTGRVDTIDWNGTRPPRRDEVLRILSQQEGKKPDAPGRIDPDLAFRPMPTQPNAGQPSTFSKITGTMWGTEDSILPPMRGVTRPLLPKMSDEVKPFTPMARAGKWAYDELVQPSSSLVGAASDWATGKVGGAIARPIIKRAAPLWKGAKSIFGYGDDAARVADEILPPTPPRKQLQIPERATAPPKYAVDEKGVATDTTRPYSPIEKKPFDPRTARGPSGNVDPNTGLVTRGRDAKGHFTKHDVPPPPSVKTSELPVVDVPSEVSAAYPKGVKLAAPKPAEPIVLPPGIPQSQRAGYERAIRAGRTAEEATEISKLHRLSPTDASVRGGPFSREYAGAPQARRVGETRSAFLARVAKEDAVNKAASALEKEAAVNPNPKVKAAAEQIKSVGSGSTSAKPNFIERFRETLKNQKGSVPRGGPVVEKKASDVLPDIDVLDPRDNLATTRPVLAPGEAAKIKKLQNPNFDPAKSLEMGESRGHLASSTDKPTATYLGEQDLMDDTGRTTSLYNIKGGPKDKSTVTRETLESMGIDVPSSTKADDKGIFGRLKETLADEGGSIPRGKTVKVKSGGVVYEVRSYDNLSRFSKRTGLTGARAQKVFETGKTYIKPITLAKPTLMTKAGRERIKAEAVDIANIPRSIMASVDLSAPLRQGITMIHKKEFYKALPKMLKAMGSEDAFQAIQHNIQKRPNAARYKKSKLALTDMAETSEREELFMSKAAEKIPVLGRLIRASGRGYVGFLNQLRADVFDDLLESAARTGAKTSDDAISKFINNATGRGGLGDLEKYAPALNAAMFSPRLMASRVNMLNPMTYLKADPFVRKEYIKSMAAFGTAATTILAVSEMAGAEVEKDPRSSDFAKIKIGNTRLDIGGGFQQYIRAGAQFVSNKRKDTETGDVEELGKDFTDKTRAGVVWDFAKAKASPIASFLITWAENKTFTGEKPKFIPDTDEFVDVPSTLTELSKSEIVRRLTPMIAQDLVDLYEEDPKLLWMAIPATLGASSQTHKIRPVRRPQ